MVSLNVQCTSEKNKGAANIYKYNDGLHPEELHVRRNFQ